MPGLQSESAIIPAVVALPESNRSPLPLGGVSGVPTLIQSRCGNKGNFELLTPMASGGLAHYWRNNDDPFVPWFGPIRFGQEAGRFEAVGMIQRLLVQFPINGCSFGKMIFWVLCRQNLRPKRSNGHCFFGQRSEVELVFLDLLC